MNSNTLNLLVKESLYRMSKEDMLFTPFNYLNIFIETANSLGISYDDLNEFLYTKMARHDIPQERLRNVLYGLIKNVYGAVSTIEENVEKTTDEHKKSLDKLNIIYSYEKHEIRDSLTADILHIKNINEILLEKLNRGKQYLEEQKKHIETLSKLAMKDPLTGCYSRRMLEEILEKNLYVYKRYDRLFSVIMIDFDDFKTINDTYGHNNGDKVLIKFSEVAFENLRQTDIFIRYGGDEFIIVLPDTNGNAAFHTAKKLKEKIESTVFKFKEAEISFKLSFGVTAALKTDTIESIIERVDKALYKSKKEHGIYIH